MYNYQYWIVLERVVTDIMIMTLLLKTKTIDYRKKYGIYMILLYFLTTVILSLMQSQIWYCLYFVLDIIMVLYMTNKSKKGVYCILVFNILIELLNYIFMYYGFIYPIHNIFLYLGPVCISFVLFMILYYVLRNKNDIFNKLNFIFNTIFFLIWIIFTKIIFRYTIYDLGMIYYILLVIIFWSVINITLSHIEKKI